MCRIENCIIASRIKKCLDQYSVRKSCSGNDDRNFQSKLVMIYERVYNELKCVLTIECSQFGFDCWDRALHHVNIEHNIKSFPLRFMDMVDSSNLDVPKFSKSIISGKLIKKNMCW